MSRTRHDSRSFNAAAYRKWYSTKRWRSIRLAQLQAEPLCRMCAEMGLIVPASVCDHVEPHRGDEAKFFGGPFQSLCAPHHNGDKQSEERTGQRRRKGSDINGYPLDSEHPWQPHA